MKYSEKMQLLMKGVKLDEIKSLEEQEAAEEAAKKAEEEAAKKAEEEAAKKAEEEKKKQEQSALEAAQAMIKDLEVKLEAKEDELTKLNKQFVNINNKQTVKEEPKHQPDASDVMKELFNPEKKED